MERRQIIINILLLLFYIGIVLLVSFYKYGLKLNGINKKEEI
jgi:uncharacterized membrane protein (DUF485 family)